MFWYIIFGLLCSLLFFFFFKQKTAYEMRISDWSSRVLFRSRTTIGAVDNGFVGIQFFNNITTGFNIAAGCTNISRAFKNLQPVIATSIDAASLAPGAATAVIVTTLPGVVSNRHRVEVTPLFPTSGLDCVAWVSGSNNEIGRANV